MIDRYFVCDPRKPMNLTEILAVKTKSYIVCAVLYEIAIILLTTRSTGTKSAIRSLLPRITLNNPQPTPTITPEGPFTLSIHPGIGSSFAAVTEIFKF